MDDDNEVRDRATFYLNVLEQKQKALNAGYILNGESFPGRAPSAGLPWQLQGLAVISGDQAATVGAAQGADLHVPSASPSLQAPSCVRLLFAAVCRGGCPEKWGLGGHGGFPRVLQP